MCGRFYAETPYEPLDNAIRELAFRNAVPKCGEVSPGDLAAVIASNRRLEPTPFGMRWGYHLPSGKLIFNTRSETASQKAMFADGISQRRCLIPANYYFEWQRNENSKTKYAIAPKDAAGILLAGIYRIENQQPVFSILTREPDASISFIHDRMPVILPEAAMGDWLNPKYRGEEILHAALGEMSYRVC